MRKNSTKTLAHFLRAMDNQTAVTIRYVKSNGEISRRAIELHSVEVTSAGNITIRAWDRRDNEMTTFRLDRITHYTLHRRTTKVAQYLRPVIAVEADDHIAVESEDFTDETLVTKVAVWTDPYQLAA